jgi:ureidoglycolate lyase
MRQVQIKLEKLTAEAFAPYGDVIQTGANNTVLPINYGMTERHHKLATPDVADKGGQSIISLFRTQAITLPFDIKLMERHPLGSQAFVMTTDNPYVVVVADAGEFDLANLRAFYADPRQGVNYHKGTWHHYCLGLNEVNEFLVVDRGGEGDNCDEIHMDDGLRIVVDF